ncbi:hypothetical protein KSP39_PZI016724 [Platanthera zijinensis]|uniref:Vps41 beta-propeller domain-containing protein n=1 Tax=Platanthera zijinensis TaxID=2320716 RepID=A0AAP0B827_9ASPA
MVRESSDHTATINDLCFDSKEEYVSSCSDEGPLVKNRLFTDKRLKFKYLHPMKSLALDPDYLRKSNRRFVSGV